MKEDIKLTEFQEEILRNAKDKIRQSFLKKEVANQLALFRN